MANDQVDQLALALSQAKRVIASVTSEQLGASTPCDQWDVRTLISHMIGGTSMFSVITRGEALPENQEETDFTVGDYVGAFDEAEISLLAAWSDPDVWSREIHFPFSALPAEIAVNVQMMEIATHTWDLARATGQVSSLDDGLAAQMAAFAAAMIPAEARSDSGAAFKAVVPVAETASPWDHLAGATGRTP